MQRAPQRLFNDYNYLRVSELTTNQAVGSSNLSGRANQNKGLPISVSPSFLSA